MLVGIPWGRLCVIDVGYVFTSSSSVAGSMGQRSPWGNNSSNSSDILIISVAGAWEDFHGAITVFSSYILIISVACY